MRPGNCAGMGFRMTEFVLYFVIAVAISQVVEAAAQVTCETAGPGSCSTTRKSCPDDHRNEANRCFDFPDTSYLYNRCHSETYPTSSSAESVITLEAVDNVRAVALFLHPLFYTLQISWAHDSNNYVHHYEVKLYQLSSSTCSGALSQSPIKIDCVGASQREKNFTLMFNSRGQEYIVAAVTPYPYPSNEQESVYTGTTCVPAPTGCHDRRNFTEPFECGPPKYSSPTHIQVHTSLMQSEIGSFTRRDIIARLEESNQMQADVSWDQPRMPAGYPPPSIYYLHVADIQHAFNDCDTLGSYCWVVNNSTSVTLKGLNASLNYTINIEAYYPCSNLPDTLNGCGESKTVRAYYPMPYLVTTSPVITSTSVLSAPTSSMSAPSSSPKITAPHSNSAPPKAVLIASTACGGLLLVVIVVAIITIIVLVRRCNYSSTYRRFDSTDPSPVVMPTTSINRIQPQQGLANNDVAIDFRRTSHSNTSPSAMSAGRYPVLVVYSSKSSEKDMKIVQQYLLYNLRTQHGIDVTSHDFSVRESLPNFIENQVKRASAVLCVCNEQFEREWKGLNPSSDSIICSFRLLFEGEVNRGRDVSKYAIVLLYQSHRKYIPSSYLDGRRQFLITQTEEIARFVKDIPSFNAPKLSGE